MVFDWLRFKDLNQHTHKWEGQDTQSCFTSYVNLRFNDDIRDKFQCFILMKYIVLRIICE